MEIDPKYEEHVESLKALPPRHINDYDPSPPRREITPAVPKQYVSSGRILTADETTLIGNTQRAVGEMMQWINPANPDTSHTRQTDSAVTVAFASIVASIPLLIFNAIVTGALILMAWWVVGGAGGHWLLGWLVIWGICGLYSFVRNREQGLYHSSSGIAHHALENQALEIKEKYSTARYALRETLGFIERQRQIGNENGSDNGHRAIVDSTARTIID